MGPGTTGKPLRDALGKAASVKCNHAKDGHPPELGIILT